MESNDSVEAIAAPLRGHHQGRQGGFELPALPALPPAPPKPPRSFIPLCVFLTELQIGSNCLPAAPATQDYHCDN